MPPRLSPVLPLLLPPPLVLVLVLVLVQVQVPPPLPLVRPMWGRPLLERL